MNDTEFKNAVILAVDDEPINLKLLERILSNNGYTSILTETDPRNVSAIYQTNRPDLILLDLNMPHCDGYQVMAQLKALNDPLLPPIVILTAQNTEQFLVKALEAGARDFVTKPFKVDELLVRVKNLIEIQLAHKSLYMQKVDLEKMVLQRTRQLHEERLQIIQRVGWAAEFNEKENGNHILRISNISALLAKNLGFDDYQCELILNASSMHDIGKINIPDSILSKPGKLDAQEWEVMKQHTLLGAQILDGNDSDLMTMAKEIALTHHEKWDGSGYPNGLAGDEIPMVGRIVAVADVFDSLTSSRPYMQKWTVEAAIELIKDLSGKHFDPKVVSVFESELEEIIKIKNQFA
ncbi:HD domain-containing phosphohydrolase [Thiomicrorhabdus sediminis]|uniref:Response regulator n=1 Tax=Thiomicrorhabdus sediminis TaxID=2580412 RepID=A0A4P9K4N1_9GAMM|nr:HD domain-containing phosphohydrolase [Thiomicrorhabdus sediminis]QCU89899.1 response regulator [Thiomicrorhabdus sediminis]